MNADVVIVARAGVTDANWPGCRVIAILDGGEVRGEVIRLRNEAPLGFVRSANRGLLLRQRDVLLLDGDMQPSLDEMATALQGSDRIAAVCAPACMLFRHVVLNMIGALDPAFSHRDDAFADWVLRAQQLGFAHRGLIGEQREPALLRSRHPHYPEQLETSARSAPVPR